MRKSTFVLLFFLFNSFLSTVSAQIEQNVLSEVTSTIETRDVPNMDEQDVKAFFDGLITGQLEALNIVGATLAVVKDGELLYAQGYGYADLENKIPVDADRTLFRIGSAAKLFTYTAIMQLVEQGMLDLNADVNQYLTKFKIPDTYPEPVRVRHLLTHTAGFEDSFIGIFDFTPEHLIPMGDFLAKTFPKRVRPPGEYSAYSNYSVALAGYIVEIVSGMPFDDYIDEHIFKPLGMHHSTFREPVPERLLKDVSKGYSHQMLNDSFKQENFEYIHKIAPAGGASNTATDMANFMIAHLQYGRFGDIRILQESTAKKMHSALYSKHPKIGAMAHGFYQMRYNGVNMIGHGGDTNFFHSNLVLLPEYNIGVFMSFNTADSAAIRETTMMAFLDRYFPATAPPSPAPAGDFAARAERYVGNYADLRRSETTFTKAMGLLDGISVRAGKDDTLQIKMGIMPGTLSYAEIGPDVFQLVSPSHRLSLLANTIAFGTDDKGDINALFLAPFMHAVKLDWFESPALHKLLLRVFTFIFIFMLISAFRQRKNVLPSAPASKIFPRLLCVTSVLNIFFPSLFLVAFAVNMGTMFSSHELTFVLIPITLTIPLVSLGLTLALIVFAIKSWRDSEWSRKRRLFYSVVTGASAVNLLILNFWNLIGYHY